MSFEEFNLKPYRHQVDCEKLISDGSSVVLRAPTGSGKSEAVFIPFLLHRDALPFHMIYSLPMRTLVEDIAGRFASEKFVKHYSGLRVVGHHGKRLDAPLFYADVIVTTIDQTVGAYACTPLSLPVRYGNIPAGAVSSAFLVFDEVHTFEPLLGLQAALVLADHAYRTGFPLAFLSATLPDTFVEELQHRFQVEVVEVKEEDIAVRRNREVILNYIDETVSPEALLKIYDSSSGKLIAVCNTVQKAQDLYEGIKGKRSCETILLHSRFLDEDRRDKESELKDIFNPKGGSDMRGILISTQVIEVGLDISSDVMISELAPIDSLIQRAGRCARRGGDGLFYVFNVESSSPYDKEFVDKTREKLKKINGEKLNWELEKDLVNDILSEPFRGFLKVAHSAGILNQLAEGAFTRSRAMIAKTVREPLSCEVSIHDNPYSLNFGVFFLKRIKIHIGVLKSFFNKSEPRVWKVNSSYTDETDEPNVQIELVAQAGNIYPYGFYVIHPDYALYSKKKGLILGKPGYALKFVEPREKAKPEYALKKESWFEHSKKTLEVFRNKFLPLYSHSIEKMASAWRQTMKEFESYVELVLVLHDLGKLNKEWQKKIGAKDKSLAHSGKYLDVKLPSHATVSAYALSNLWEKLPFPLGSVFEFAIAHHHSVAAKKVPKYVLKDNYQKDVSSVLNLTDCDTDFNIIDIQESSTSLKKFPFLVRRKPYRTYCLVSRILRLSDWIATAGSEDTLSQFEELYKY